MTYENNRFELGLGRLVDLAAKADFIARDALTRIHDEGWKQKIVGVIGYAWLPVKHTELGTHVAVETPEGMRDATIAPMAFFDPEKQIPKS
jgi:glycine cleavage system aminomethyltransferase T